MIVPDLSYGAYPVYDLCILILNSSRFVIIVKTHEYSGSCAYQSFFQVHYNANQKKFFVLPKTILWLSAVIEFMCFTFTILHESKSKSFSLPTM